MFIIRCWLVSRRGAAGNYGIELIQNGDCENSLEELGVVSRMN
ncbi:hypothetical protein PR118_002664 [Bacillus atrophaeus]|nr:hypothetical protein [Bacillus atrophaeus]